MSHDTGRMARRLVWQVGESHSDGVSAVCPGYGYIYHCSSVIAHDLCSFHACLYPLLVTLAGHEAFDQLYTVRAESFPIALSIGDATIRPWEIIPPQSEIRS